MKTIIGKIHLRNKLEGGIHFIFCSFNCVIFFTPGKQVSGFTKRISSISTERMPVGARESKMILQFLSACQPVLIIPAKGHWVITIGTFILYATNVFEIFFF